MDEIKKIYENKVISFENTDDSYKSKMSAYYSEWSSMGDKFSDAGNAIKDFMTGVWDSLAGTVMGLLTVLAFYRHKKNIKRLLDGTESKIYLSKKNK